MTAIWQPHASQGAAYLGMAPVEAPWPPSPENPGPPSRTIAVPWQRLGQVVQAGGPVAAVGSWERVQEIGRYLPT